jgi:hypothetical protein
MEGFGELPELDIALAAGLDGSASPLRFANGGGSGGGGGGGASGSLRCVDASHGPGCERCVVRVVRFVRACRAPVRVTCFVLRAAGVTAAGRAGVVVVRARSCLPPPAEADEEQYMLVGDKTKVRSSCCCARARVDDAQT